MSFDNPRRISVFCGHYGSGKTEIALNFCRRLRLAHDKVMIVDLDIVNPFFRTKDAQETLSALDIKVISPPYANTNIEMPTLLPQVYSAFDDSSYYAVLDVGGDDAGAAVLGAMHDRFEREGYDMYYVANMCRALTHSAQEAYEYLLDIQNSSRLRVSGIINNTNLASETSADLVLSSIDFANELSKLSGLPLEATCILSRLSGQLNGKVSRLFPIDIHIRRIWSDENEEE